MSILRTARIITAATLAIAAVGVAASPAGATLHSPADSYTATPCKLDTSPKYPSCGTTSATLRSPADSFVVEACRLDTSPSYPSCGTDPR